jgi:hypothetical protein
MARRTTVLLSFALVAVMTAWNAPSAQAQNILMNSAETINQGNFKIAVFPTVLLGEDDADNNWGVGGRFGYGFTPRFDMEAKLAVFDDLKIYGLDAEAWLVKGRPLDVSASLGLHKADSDVGIDSSAIDVALLGSGHVGDKLEVYGGLNFSFESLDDVDDSDFTRAYVVPGIEYKLGESLDLLAEIGVGLNDDSPNYVSFGLAFYLR